MRWAVTSNTALVPFREALMAGNVEEAGISPQKSSPANARLALCGNSFYAAGFVVRRFAIRNASPNINNENRTRVAIDAASDDSPAVAG